MKPWGRRTECSLAALNNPYSKLKVVRGQRRRMHRKSASAEGPSAAPAVCTVPGHPLRSGRPTRPGRDGRPHHSMDDGTTSHRRAITDLQEPRRGSASSNLWLTRCWMLSGGARLGDAHHSESCRGACGMLGGHYRYTED